MSLIKDPATITAFCDAARTAPFIVLDTEFMRRDTYYAKLCLVQLATHNQAIVVDALAADLSPIWALLRTTDCPKVVHSGYQDIEIIVQLAGFVPTPIMDTQVIAGLVDAALYGVGFDKLAAAILGISVDKSSQASNWAIRPLSAKQLEYARLDVVHLADIYRKLVDKLDASNRLAWAVAEMQGAEEMLQYQPNTTTAGEKLRWPDKSPAALQIGHAAANWREIEAVRHNKPRRHLLADEVLFTIASRRPNSEAKLASLMPYPQMAASLWQALQDAPAVRAPSTLPNLTLHQQPVKLMLEATVQVLAATENVAEKLLLISDELNSITRTRTLVGTRLATDWRHDIAGKEIEALLAGKRTLKLEKQQVVLGSV